MEQLKINATAAGATAAAGTASVTLPLLDLEGEPMDKGSITIKVAPAK